MGNFSEDIIFYRPVLNILRTQNLKYLQILNYLLVFFLHVGDDWRVLSNTFGVHFAFTVY